MTVLLMDTSPVIHVTSWIRLELAEEATRVELLPKLLDQKCQCGGQPKSKN